MKTKQTGKSLLLKQAVEVQLDNVEMKGVRGGEDLPPAPPDSVPPDIELTGIEFRRRAVTVW